MAGKDKKDRKDLPESVYFEMLPEKETKGAHRLKEVDSDGDEIETVDAKIGSLYLRKSAVGKKVDFQFLKCDLSFHKDLS